MRAAVDHHDHRVPESAVLPEGEGEEGLDLVLEIGGHEREVWTGAMSTPASASLLRW